MPEDTPEPEVAKDPMQQMFERRRKPGEGKRLMEALPEEPSTDEKIRAESVKRFAAREKELMGKIREVDMSGAMRFSDMSTLSPEGRHFSIWQFHGEEPGGGVKFLARTDKMVDSERRGKASVSIREMHGNDAPQKLGINSNLHLNVTVHSDEPTREQYEASAKTNPHNAWKFGTIYFIDEGGNMAKVSSLPDEIKDERTEVPTYESMPSGVKDVVSDVTPEDFEIVDASLTVLEEAIESYEKAPEPVGSTE